MTSPSHYAAWPSCWASTQAGSSSAAGHRSQDCGLHKDPWLRAACGHIPATDLRGEKTSLTCTMTICWPTRKPKGSTHPGAKRAGDCAEPQEPGQVTYEHDRGLAEGGPGILGVLQALAEKCEGAVSVGVHLGKRTPRALSPHPDSSTPPGAGSGDCTTAKPGPLPPDIPACAPKGHPHRLLADHTLTSVSPLPPHLAPLLQLGGTF